MDDLVYENYIPTIRKSLYGSPEIKPSQSGHKRSKKMKPDRNDTYSNLQVPRQPKKRSSNQQQQKTCQQSKNKSSHQHQEQSQDNGSQRRQAKKKQVVISFSSSNESVNEDVKSMDLSPSKSELEELFPLWGQLPGPPNSTFSTNQDYCDKRGSTSNFAKDVMEGPRKRKNSYSTNSSSDSIRERCKDGRGTRFNLDTFFSKYDIGSSNNDCFVQENLGIDDQFISDYTKDVKVLTSESIVRNGMDYNKNEDASNEVEMNSCIAEDGSSSSRLTESDIDEFDTVAGEECSTEESATDIDEEEAVTRDACEEEAVTAIANQIEESVVLDDDDDCSELRVEDVEGVQPLEEPFPDGDSEYSDVVNLFSPRGSALLYIKNVTQTRGNQWELLGTEELGYGRDIAIEENCAAFLCYRLEDYSILFVEKYIAQQIFPKVDNADTPQVILNPNEDVNTIQVNPAWDDILETVNAGTRLMLAGGKGVGKSTLLRFSINRLLSKFNKVRVLDLDPGQSEFSVPGCVAIVTVTKPVFGPNFTHLKQTDRSLLSNINVGYDPKAYIKRIKSLVAYLGTLEGDYPLLINYMGFSQGIGVNIIASAIKHIQPTDILQIESSNQNRNFKEDLTPQMVMKNCKLFSEDDEDQTKPSKVNYKLHKVAAMSDEYEGWSFEPRTSRELNILAYFGLMMKDGIKTLTSQQLPMYQISLSDIKITDLKGEEIAPAAVNANLVALCSLDQESNIFQCLGHGIVRGVDPQNDILVLITPEPPSVLEKVYYLVLGSVSLPPVRLYDY
ncbi:hypothetical protein NQ315_003053 [Exocentrus adspersus]|uniref:Polynucleotide 5'-hydroxyl-kinase NOL9 n=1 Tax=Exocentrus adspersus TaxID=1586481 RepID=A0AAV8W534_9CUCU|nr:hypothetical protein NQ315_003053 [Exocentrus adspersus]